jgi:hypothetical protein
MSTPLVALAGAHHAVSYQRIVDSLSGPDGPAWSPPVGAYLRRAFAAL